MRKLFFQNHNLLVSVIQSAWPIGKELPVAPVTAGGRSWAFNGSSCPLDWLRPRQTTIWNQDVGPLTEGCDRTRGWPSQVVRGSGEWVGWPSTCALNHLPDTRVTERGRRRRENEFPTNQSMNWIQRTSTPTAVIVWIGWNAKEETRYFSTETLSYYISPFLGSSPPLETYKN